MTDQPQPSDQTSQSWLPSPQSEPAAERAPHESPPEVQPPQTAADAPAPVEPAPPAEASPAAAAAPVPEAPPAEPAALVPEAPPAEAAAPAPPRPAPAPPPFDAPAADGSAGGGLLDERPEIAVGAVFAGGFLAAQILKRLGRQ